MASAPETISIKRRRDDGVVDILALTSNKKQRTSGHYFVRLGHGHGASVPSVKSTPTVHPYRSPPGVPTIATTQPGDEVRDFQNYKAAQDSRNGIPETHATANAAVSGSSQLPPNARRFHLTRDLSLVHRPQQAGGSRKPASSIRPHLPTFIEKPQDAMSYAEPPVDRIISLPDGVNHMLDVQRILSDDGSVKKEKTATFQQVKPSIARTGQSIRDNPATWDLDSDRLADELMNLALEMDPDAMAAFKAETIVNHNAAPPTAQADAMLVDGPDDYVYETYVRVQEKGIHDLGDLTNSNNLGYLVIDEDQEDLWDQYLRDEDDSDDDWDEEDADSNAEDNPRNDYPEDEVSSDDEYDRNIYQYRRDYSDDEQHY